MVERRQRKLSRRPNCVVFGGFRKGAALFRPNADLIPSPGMNVRVSGGQMGWFHCKRGGNLPRGGRFGRRGGVDKIGEEGALRQVSSVLASRSKNKNVFLERDKKIRKC